MRACYTTTKLNSNLYFPKENPIEKLSLHWEGGMQDNVIVKKKNQKPSLLDDCQDADKNIPTKPMFALTWYDVNKNKQCHFF